MASAKQVDRARNELKKNIKRNSFKLGAKRYTTLFYWSKKDYPVLARLMDRIQLQQEGILRRVGTVGKVVREAGMEWKKFRKRMWKRGILHITPNKTCYEITDRLDTFF